MTIDRFGDAIRARITAQLKTLHHQRADAMLEEVWEELTTRALAPDGGQGTPGWDLVQAARSRREQARKRRATIEIQLRALERMAAASGMTDAIDVDPAPTDDRQLEAPSTKPEGARGEHDGAEGDGGGGPDGEGPPHNVFNGFV